MNDAQHQILSQKLSERYGLDDDEIQCISDVIKSDISDVNTSLLDEIMFQISEDLLIKLIRAGAKFSDHNQSSFIHHSSITVVAEAVQLGIIHWNMKQGDGAPLLFVLWHCHDIKEFFYEIDLNVIWGGTTFVRYLTRKGSLTLCFTALVEHNALIPPSIIHYLDSVSSFTINDIINFQYLMI
jgi:hypothetical protein